MRRFDRPTIDLDGTWRFVPDAEQVFAADRLPAGQAIAVPGCWEAQVERPYQIITAWYARTFEVPEDWADRPALIRFGAVMYHCEVWLNGRPVGEHEGGYTEFAIPVGGVIRAGSNELVVRVINPLNAISDYPALAVERALSAEEWAPDLPLTQAPHGKQTWYSSQSGIWRSVSLERTSDLWLDSVRVLPDVAESRADVWWTLARSAVGAGSGLSITTRLDAPDGSRVLEESHMLPDGTDAGRLSLHVPDPVLWDTDSPALYRMTATLHHGAETIDSISVRFGMRSITTSDGRLLLNGTPILLRGALDQDIYPETISGAPSRAFLEHQFRLAREMGLNLLRCHIKSPDPMYAEVADECGVLLWCELPNWTVFSDAAARRGTRTLEDMVVALGNHPSIIAWTIINEDWGTNLRFEARDRLWLRRTVARLRMIDPSRLIVDNSACETPQTPNFHVETDVLDFHAYFVSPDNAHRWSSWVAEFARRPAFLWSPHEDAVQTGHEPLVLSEFGSWGLPDPGRIAGADGHPPWWFGTGHGYYRPAGIRRRFARLGLDRLWPDVASLAVATQWHQFENFQYEVAELRRHASIAGFVVTEFTDATWEANGLLDINRGPKAFHERLSAVNAPDVAVTNLARRDVRGGSVLEVPFWVSSFGRAATAGDVAWDLTLADGTRREGVVPVASWPDHTSALIGAATIEVPEVGEATDARLSWSLRDARGTERSADSLRLAVLPAAIDGPPLAVAVHDPLGMWGIAERVAHLGHRSSDLDASDVLVAASLDERVVDHADAGGHVLVLVRTQDAVPQSVDLARRVSVQLRRLPAAGWPGQRSPWEGDWVTSFSWMLPELQRGLPDRRPLDFAYTEVLPDHVLLGYDPVRHADEVSAGMFVGWVHAPAAIEWRFPQGAGSITLTTFRVAPEAGPVATHLLDRLLRRAAEGG